MKPYHFEPVYPIAEAIELGKRVAGGAYGLAEIKEACGIAGCVLEKHSGPEPFGSPADESLADCSIEQLGELLADAARKDFDDGVCAAAPGAVPVWLQIVLALIERLLRR
jgi:hypothetical protein